MDLAPITAGLRLRADAAAAFWRAVAAGAPRQVTSAWRDPARQQYLRDQYLARVPGFNFALPPEQSKHCAGLAIDVPGTAGDPATAKGWWTKNGRRFGFYGVSNEDWHFEYRKDQDPSLPREKDNEIMRRYGNRRTPQQLTPHRWTTVQVTDKNGVSTAFGAKHFDTDLVLQVNAPEGTQLRLRFYKLDYSTGKRTYTYDGESKIDTPISKGKTMMALARLKGECRPNERVRAEVYTWNTGVTLTAASYRTDEY